MGWENSKDLHWLKADSKGASDRASLMPWINTKQSKGIGSPLSWDAGSNDHRSELGIQPQLGCAEPSKTLKEIVN